MRTAAGGGVSEGAVEEVAEMVDSVAVDLMVDSARAQVTLDQRFCECFCEM